MNQVARSGGVSRHLLEDVIARRIDPYHEFSLPKARKGSKRVIAAPIHDLAQVQRAILSRLTSATKFDGTSFAYSKGVSISDCAVKHLGARWLVKLDLADFFHSVDEDQVARVFSARGCDSSLSRQLARLCTRTPMGRPDVNGRHAPSGFGDSRPGTTENRLGHLPQGAPTSGMLANLVAYRLDLSLSRLALKSGLKYTRYSDDLTFSSQGEFSRQDALHFVRCARTQIASHHFTMHEGKIRICPPGSRLQVLGLLVDTDRLHLRSDFKKTLKWHVYGSSRFGVGTYSASRGFPSPQAYLSHVHGLMSHAVDIEPEWARPLQTSWLALSEVQSCREGSEVSVRVAPEA
ncbi:reverse transcriptase family protein [Arthrobacter sp. NPDC058288]|uniref:reverse transcriptase family protein n=1 Tax=Arthrobacter sp. NPDC058288 TaxID=3346424 RepID=UPI0036E9E7A4